MAETGEPEVFRYEEPEVAHKKNHVPLTRTDSFKADIQIVREGGANNLHSHTGNDGFWYVLEGAGRFYTEDDEVVAEVEAGEGILIPHDYPYWFEKASGEPMKILHVSSYVEGVEDRRVDHQTHWREQATD